MCPAPTPAQRHNYPAQRHNYPAQRHNYEEYTCRSET